MGSFRRQLWLACAAAALAATHAFMAPATRAATPPRRAERTVVQGIPKMFRWLTDQYPSIMERISDGLPAQGERGAVVDNLYLDMNGIIHMCTHSNDAELVVMSEREQFVRIFTFTDKICKIVRPSTCVYLAVDGVAPRAKMNQQRSRRFRSSLEREELMKELLAAGEDVPSDADAFDSNCITPGTEFMYKLGVAFRAWLTHKCATDPFYGGDGAPRIFFSGPDLPGEGEHKVMDYIRECQAGDEAWAGKDLKHCFYGLDADLIMLSLVTHEPNFRLLREKMSVRHARKGKKPKDPLDYGRYDFELLEVGLLREMLQLQFRPDPTAELAARSYDLERIVDDFVFICMLVGNDFLPNMPHLEIVDGSLDLMMASYRELLPVMQGYVTDKEKLHLPRLELLLRSLAAYEPTYFARRGALEKVPEYEDPKLYADHYYYEKFGLMPGDVDARKQLAADYVLGLFWCVQYYHRGVASWDWYYPHLYAPLASDLVDLPELPLEFPTTGSRPFTPLMQLMSVLPAQSSRLLPRPYADLMTDTNSPLADAYPATFDVDQNGKAAPWEAVVLIPFIDEDAMVAELSAIDHNAELTPRERARNDVGAASLWTSADVPNVKATKEGKAQAAR